MTDKLDELASNIDDAVRTSEELKDEPGPFKEKQIDKIVDALNEAQVVVRDLEDVED